MLSACWDQEPAKEMDDEKTVGSSVSLALSPVSVDIKFAGKETSLDDTVTSSFEEMSEIEKLPDVYTITLKEKSVPQKCNNSLDTMSGVAGINLTEGVNLFSTVVSPAANFTKISEINVISRGSLNGNEELLIPRNRRFTAPGYLLQNAVSRMTGFGVMPIKASNRPFAWSKMAVNLKNLNAENKLRNQTLGNDGLRAWTYLALGIPRAIKNS